MYTVWMVCQAKDGKYFDGFYGMDCNIHSEYQIFNQENIPYFIDSEFKNIVVGIENTKPSVIEVQKILARHKQ
jgi:hypothetical protein